MTRPQSPLVSAAAERLRSWNGLSWPRKCYIHWRFLSAKLIKSELWETLAIIGATQLVVLPWIGSPFGVRLFTMAVFGAAHAFFSYWIGWDFLYGINGNWMSRLWMTGTDRGWDGGIFGPINWAVVMLGGTLAYDIVAGSVSQRSTIVRLALWGSAFMAIGYGMSCLTRLYDLNDSELAELRPRHERDEAEKSALSDTLKRERQALIALRGSPNHSQTTANARAQEQIEATIVVLEDRLRERPDLSLAPSPVLPSWERGGRVTRSDNFWQNHRSSRPQQTGLRSIRRPASSTVCEIIGCWENACPISRSSSLAPDFNSRCSRCFRPLVIWADCGSACFARSARTRWRPISFTVEWHSSLPSSFRTMPRWRSALSVSRLRSPSLARSCAIWNEPACIGVFDPRGLRGLTSGAKNSVWTEFNAFLEFRPPKKGHSACAVPLCPGRDPNAKRRRHTRSRSIPRRSRTDDSQGPDP